MQLNLVHFGKKSNNDETEVAVQRIAKKVLNSQ